MDALPYRTPDLSGCGGELKAEPAYFVVEELPLYEASGQGQHLYVSLTREDWTTRHVIDALARLFGLRSREIGYAGLKDRHARCTQIFSLPDLQPDDARRIAEALPFEINWAQLHRNKLKPGHLAGNRFEITISSLAVPPDEALARVQAVATALAASGVPNFFGAQRFGIDGANAERGRQVLLGGGPHDRWLRKLLISAYQSHLFNRYLARRLELGLFGRLILGDVAKKADTGGMFDVQDPAAEQPRYERGEIHFTGPMYGRKMWRAKEEAGALEAAILAEDELSEEYFQRAKVEGTRRPGRIWLTSLDLSAGDDTLQLRFTLPKGAYATVVLREFMKRESEAGLLLDDNDASGSRGVVVRC